MSNTKLLQTRIDADVLARATNILDELGLSVTESIRAFLKEIIRTERIPLSFSLSSNVNPKTINQGLLEIESKKPLLQLSQDQDIADFVAQNFN